MLFTNEHCYPIPLLELGLRIFLARLVKALPKVLSRNVQNRVCKNFFFAQNSQSTRYEGWRNKERGRIRKDLSFLPYGRAETLAAHPNPTY